MIEEMSDVEYDEMMKELKTYKRKAVQLKVCLKTMRWFCDRVDAGEVRSVKTYNRFKELVLLFDSDTS